MNISYRNLWNPILGTWVAVSELTRGRGKRSGGSVALAGAALVLIGSMPTTGFAQSTSWLPTGTGNWSDVTNWSTGNAPDVGNAVTVDQGTAQIDSDNTIGSLAGGAPATLTFTGVGDTRLTLGGDNTTTTFAGAINGAGGITKEGTGTFTLSGANTYSGITTINAGTLQAGEANTLSSNSAVVLANTVGARLNLNGFDQTIGSLAGGGTTGGSMSLANSTLTVGGDNTSTSYAGMISGNGNLTKVGTGTLILTGNNIINNITVSDGTLQGNSNSLKGFGTFGGTIVNNAALVFDQTAAGTYSGEIQGSGSVTKIGTGTLTLLAYMGDFTGTLTVTDGVLQSHTGVLQRDITNNANVTFNQTVDGSYGSGISGSGSVTKVGTSTLTLTNGYNTYTGGTIISAGTLALSGNAFTLQGSVDLNGVGAKFDVSGLNGNSSITGLSGIAGTTVTLGNTLLVNTAPGQTYTYAGSITGSGSLRKSGGGTQILTGANNYTGGTTVAGQGILQGNSTSLQGNITISNANATVVFDQDANGSYAGTIGGVGRLTKEGVGNLTLSGNNSHSGATTVNDGTLSVNGSLSNSNVTVNNGATLAVNGSITNAVTVNDGATLVGNGTVGNTTVASGGMLAPGSTMGALTVAGNLTLDSGSQLNFAFGAPGTQSEPGNSNQIQINGNLNLNGTTLNVSDAGNFGAGLYRLFNYTGTLSESNGGIILGSTPTDAANLIIQRLSVQSQINLINTSGLTLSYWNGNGQAGAGQSGGGDGSWSNMSQNWTDAFGLQTAAMQPQPGFAIFAGDAGNVTVDNSAGDVEVTGLQFASNGYNLHGDTLTLSGDGIVRVGDGTAAGASYVATINNVIDGSSGLTKTDLGKLVLTTANTYTGGTTINAGTLSISADDQLGDASNQLSFNGGTLQTTSDVTTSRATTLDAGGGTLAVDSGTTLSHQGDIGGVGGLTKSGDGMLVLSGVNTYSGATTINAGTLQAGASNTLSSDSAVVLANTANAVLDLNGFDQTIGSLAGGGAAGGNVLLGLATLTTGGDNTSTTYAGAINGDGNLNKVGTGAWTLAGDNSNYSGSTLLDEGALVLGSNAALGSSVLYAADGTTLDASTAVSISNELDLAGNLNIGGSADLTLNGTVNGAGGLTKNGNAKLTLNGVNEYLGDTVLNAGTLIVGNASALGHGNLTVTGSATLDNNASLSLSNAIALNGNLTIGGSNALILDGGISGTGGLTKDGNAMLTLSGVNNYSGSTTINNGVLQAATNNTLSANSAVVLADVAGASLDLNGFDQTIGSLAGGGAAGGNVLLGLATLTTGGDNTSTTYTGVISGDGTLIKTGTGTMTLAGANSHRLTIIEDGTLQVGAANVFASNSTIVLAEAAGVNLALNGHDQSIGSLMDGGTTGGNVDLGVATLTLGNEDMSSSFYGKISGSGSLVKVGSGDLALFGANDYSGGTTVSGGTLAGDSSSLQGNIINNASTIFIQAGVGSGTYAGAMSGSGTLGVTLGTLILSNSNNSYTGGTEVSTATLQGDSRSLQGNILLNDGSSSVIFAQGVNGTYAGTISGFGDLIKDGVGKLTLSGVHTYNGNTSINEGTLTVNGALSNDSTVSVGNGATLDGSGTVGTTLVADGGALASGNATGALTINGVLELNSGSQLNFALGSPGNSNQIQVNGNLFLGGTTLNVSDAGNFGPGLYRLINYTGSLIEDNGGIALGSTPADATNLSIQSLSANKQINLINTSGLTLNYWNGNGQASANQSGGGAGVWSNTSANWTDDVGSMTGPMQPQPSFAIFAGDAGLVGIDNSAGNVEVTGLQFASDGYNLDGDTLTLGGTGIVRVGDGGTGSANYVATINNIIDGNVGLTKTDAGTLVLRGENTYTGGTVINGGTLSIYMDANLGDSSGHLTLNGGTLATTDSMTTARATTLGANGGTLSVDTVATLTHHGDIDGVGSLTKTGDGTLRLTGANTYSGGTTVAAGALVGDSNSLQGNILNNAQLVFDQVSVGSGTYTGTISGSGKLSVAMGSLILGSSQNSYSGGTDVYDATLQGDSRSLQGNIDFTGPNGGSVIFAQGINGTYAGTLSGDGSLVKQGSGNLILSSTNTYSGDTTINGGTLTVNGSIINSLLYVNSGGTLGGNGTVLSTTIDTGGVLAPGNTSGALTVDGTLNFAAGSFYRVQVDAAGNTDRVNVSDIAILNGGTVDVRASTGAYAANTTYTILNAVNGLGGVGSFDGVSSNLAFLTPTLSYDTNNVFLHLERNSVSFSTVAATSNQLGISSALESAFAGATGDMSTVMTAITGLSADQARRAYDSMSGASLSAMSRAGAGFSAGVGSQMRARLAAVSGNSSSAYAFGTPVQLTGNDHVYDLFSTSSPVSNSSSGTASGLTGLGASADSSLTNYGRGFWLRGYGNYQSTSSDGNAAASTVRSNGLSVGFDTEVSEGLIAGVAGTFGKSSLRFDSSDSGRSRDRALAAYASYKAGPWNFNGSANFAFNSSNMERQIVVGALTRTATSAFDGHTASLYGEATYDIQMQDWMLQPLAALSLSRSKTDGFTEQGAGALNLQVAGQTTNSVKMLFGAKAQFEVGQVKLEPRLAWGHEFGDANAPMTMQFAGSAAPSFLISGVKLPRDSVIAGLGLSSNISKRSNSNLSVFADIQGEYNSRQSNVALLVGIRSRW